jgi:hypothetical protein
MLFYRDVRTLKEQSNLGNIDVAPDLIEQFYIDEETEHLEM